LGKVQWIILEGFVNKADGKMYWKTSGLEALALLTAFSDASH
jgi:hypothetical protein